MPNFKLGTIITGIAVVVILTALAYLAGAASASDGQSDSHGGLLAQLRSGREDGLVSKALRLLDRQYFRELTDEDKDMLRYGALDGMMRVLHEDPFDDQFSNFYSPELYADLQAQTTGEYAGVGILMGISADGMYPEIVTVFDNTPAQESGIREGDIISAVDGEDAFGRILPEIAVRIKGEPGTNVELTVYRPDDDDFIDFNIERRSVEFSSISRSELLSDEIGLVEISGFAEDTAADFRAAVENLQEQGMEVLIIDLRNNTGGLYEAALDVANCFIAEGTIVKVQRRDDFEEVYADPDASKYDLQLVILQNSSSASASEILTGALKDQGLAKVVGEQSFGKGVIQAVMPLEFHEEPVPGQDSIKSALAITIGNYLTPDGSDIHGTCIEPNVWYELSNQMEEDPELGRLQDLLEDKREEMRSIRSQIAQYIRDNDAALSRAEEIAGLLQNGVAIADVARFEPEEEEHSPLGAGSSTEAGGDQDVE